MPRHMFLNGGRDAIWIRVNGGPLELPREGGDGEGISFLEGEGLAPGAWPAIHLKTSSTWISI